MHAAISSKATVQASRAACRFASSTMLKRPINARPRKTPAFLQTASSPKENSTLALESLARLRGSSAEKLSWEQVRTVLLSAAVPMVGFGFMDNFVMIQAGSYIDSTIGVQFGLATMTAAAMGQVVSDVSGVLFGGTLERMLSPWVKPAKLTAAQQRLAIVPRLRLAGAVVGVMVGCCLGATALFFVPDAQLEEEQLQQLGGVVYDMMATDSLKGASCTMHTTSRIPATYEAGSVSVVCLNDSSLASQCREQRELLVEGDSLFVPVSTSGEGDVLAVLELKQDCGFSSEEMEAAQTMARHIAIFMNRVLID